MTKPMARLEFEMPEFCGECPLLVVAGITVKNYDLVVYDSQYTSVCAIINATVVRDKPRPKWCPLKEVTEND